MDLNELQVSISKESQGWVERMSARVAMVVFSHYPGDNRPRREAEALIETGMSVDMICLKGNEESAIEEVNGVMAYRIKLVRKRGSKFRYLFEYGTFFLAAFLKLSILHLRKRYDIVHIHNVPDILVVCALVPRFTGAKLILDIHDIMPEFYMRKYGVGDRFWSIKWIKFLEKISVRFVHHVIIASPLMRRKLIARSSPPGKCSTILNLPDPRYFQKRPHKQSSTSDAFKLIYPGTISEVHGVDIAVRALHRVFQKEKLPIEFHIYGFGAPVFRNELEALIQQLGLEQNVIFQEPIPAERYLEVLHTMNAGIVPKRSGVFADLAMSTKLMEFAAVGLPAIVSRTPSDSLFFDNSCVAFFEPENEKDLAQTIINVVKDPDARATRVSNARQVLDRVNWTIEKAKFQSLFLELCGNGAAMSRDELETFETDAFSVAARSHGRNRGIDGNHRLMFTQKVRKEEMVVDPIIDSSLEVYFRCPQDSLAVFRRKGTLSGNTGFFRFGEQLVCYGRTSAGSTHSGLNANLHDVLKDLTIQGRIARLVFDPDEVADNLRLERYFSHGSRNGWLGKRGIQDAYYRVRPLFPVPVRKHLQRLYLKGWESIPFPSWPVDRSVDLLMERLLALSLQVQGEDRIPFIWFWPNGHGCGVIVTHDVESETGRDFCSDLMDIDDSFQIKSSFEVVPESRYEVTEGLLDSIREKGFEIAVHGLSHDGRLFDDRQEFLRRAKKINEYGRLFGAVGFRAPAMHRKPDWFDALDFSYDMSIPNVAHLEPQRGGCCTVMPYFIGDILELPLTGAQDYSLFHILNDYSIDLWVKQFELVEKSNGLFSFIAHPDYLREKRAQDTYKKLLEFISRVRSERNVWIALPREVDRWWRQRSQMELVPEGESWRIEGPGHEKARLAYASLDGDRVVYEVEQKGSRAYSRIDAKT